MFQAGLQDLLSAEVWGQLQESHRHMSTHGLRGPLSLDYRTQDKDTKTVYWLLLPHKLGKQGPSARLISHVLRSCGIVPGCKVGMSSLELISPHTTVLDESRAISWE